MFTSYKFPENADVSYCRLMFLRFIKESLSLKRFLGKKGKVFIYELTQREILRIVRDQGR